MLATVGTVAVLLLVLGFPLWLIFLLSSVLGLYFYTTVPMEVVVQNLFGSLDKYVLLAVPGFIFAGEVMARSGMSRKLIDWVYSIVGRIPGSLPLTTLATSEVFGAISGSSPATVAALGKILYPGLRDRGYPEKFGLGLITSAGAIAIVIPPSITMILYSSLTNVSLGALFLAGFLPGVLIGLCLAGYCIWYSVRHGLVHRERFSFMQVLRQTARAAWTLGAPLVIFGGIYSGLFTPTEAAGMVAFYAVIVTMAIERSLDWRGLWDVTLETALLTSKIFLIVAASGLFSWVLTVSNVPQTLVGAVASWQVPGWMVLVMINIVLLIAGMFIDPTSALLVLTPLLFPMAQHIGVDPIHFGIIMTVNLAIGMFTPPFGLNIFVSSSIFNVSASRVAASLGPFIVANLVALVLITYVPVISMWLPSLVGR